MTAVKVSLRAVELPPGVPLPSLGLLAAVDAGARRPHRGMGQDATGRPIGVRRGPHVSAQWIRSALVDLTADGGPIDLFDWAADDFDPVVGVWESRPGGFYYVHERGEDPAVWLVAPKADMVAWLGERGYERPPTGAGRQRAAGEVRRVKVGKRGAGVAVRTVDPESAPVPAVSVGEGTAGGDGLAGSVSRHPSGWPRRVMVAELERRDAKRAAVRAGMDKRAAFNAFPPESDEWLRMGRAELVALAGVDESAVAA